MRSARVEAQRRSLLGPFLAPSLGAFVRVLVTALLTYGCGGPKVDTAPGAQAAAPQAVHEKDAQRRSGVGGMLPIHDEDLRIGADAADVTVVAFLDASRPSSRSAFFTLKALAERSKGTRVVFKHASTHPYGEQVAGLALAVARARGQAASIEFLSALLKASAPLSQAELLELAFSGAGSTEPRAYALQIDEQLARDRALYGRVSLDVPCYYVNGLPVPELAKREELERHLAAEVSKVNALRRRYPEREALYTLRVQDNLHGAAHRADPDSAGEDDGATPSWGSADAPVTIVAFLDFQCPFCARVMSTLDQLKERYGPGRIRLVYRHNPLPFHKHARPAAEAAAAVFSAGGSRAFLKFQALAFANQKELTEENFARWAEQAGVSGRVLADAEALGASVVEADLALGKELGVTGTPAFRVNGLVVSGAQPFERFQEVIDAQLEKAAELERDGVPGARISRLLTEQQRAEVAPAKEPEPPTVDTTVFRVPVDKADPVLGPADALVTIIYFANLQCPFTARAHNTLEEVLQRYGADVRIVWKDNPLPFHQRAAPAATAARAVYDRHGNALFWPFVKQVFAGQRDLSDDALVAAAKAVGANEQNVRRALQRDPYAVLLKNSRLLAEEVQARGTPHFFVNGRRLSGAQPLEKFEALIDAELVKAKALIDGGVARDKLYDTLMQSARGPEPPEQRSVAAPIGPAPFRGPKNAKLVIEIFSEFQCPFCERVRPTLAQLMKKYPNVKFVWRHLPLPFHADAHLAAEAAHEVFEQKGSAAFFTYADALFDAQKTGMGREVLERLAQKQGVNMKRFNAALDSRKHQARVESDKTAANAGGIQGTPSFTIGKYFLSGAQPIESFERLLGLQTK